ncbi:MAG: isocitrate lyase/PEP mutase family protein [Rhodobacterales bacterium]|nr:isocitrate lyase/PEP mutase family protein [Rhodobacterales bacterium]
MRRTTRFRDLIERPEILMLPGVQDALSAKIAEQAGFQAITCGGYATSATLLGEPDTSQLSLTEMADHYARICDAVDIPLFGDGDTGFGNVTNVARTVRLYERTGLAGMFIEDQVFPKRCGHMAGKQVIPAVDMVAKVQAALDARTDPDFVIMARTDAVAVNGLDDAIERMALYREAGADLLFVEAPRTEADMRRICTELDGPCMANMIEGGQTPVLPLEALQEIGFAVVTYPVALTYALASTTRDLMAHMAAKGTTVGFPGEMMDFDEFNAVIGLAPLRDREQHLMESAQALAAETAGNGAD